MQWLTTVLAVRFTDFSIAGVYALAISFTNIFYFLALFGIRNYQISDVNHRFAQEQYTGIRLTIAGITIAVFLAALCITNSDKYTKSCYLLYMLFKLGEIYTDGFFAVLQTKELYGRIALSYCAKAIFPGIAFALSLYLSGDLRLAIAAMTLLYGVVVLTVDLHFWRLLDHGKPCLKDSTGIVIHSLPLLLASLTVPIMNYATRKAVEDTMNHYWVGQYASLSSVIVVMSTFAGAVFVVMIPEASRLIQQKDNKALGKMSSLALVGMLFCSILAIAAGKLFGAPVCILIFGAEIIESIGLLVPLLVTASLLMVKSFLSAMLTAMERRRMLLVGEYCGMSLCALTAWKLTERYGLQGANISYMAGVVMQLIILGTVFIFTLTGMRREDKKG
jgi:O-antigen/teichoic acid export membrane protein